MLHPVAQLDFIMDVHVKRTELDPSHARGEG